MKKSVCIISIIIVVTILIFVGIFLKKENNEETSDVEFKICDVKYNNNEEITVKIETTNDCEFVAANFSYEYNDEKIEYIGYTQGESFKDAAMFLVNKDENSNKIYMGYVSNPESNNKIVKAGEIINLRFKNKNNKNGNVENKLECTTLKNEKGEDVTFKINQGEIIHE